jgi:phage gp36-like protein
MVAPFAALGDLEARYPSELTLLAADENTGLRDDARINLAIDDATTEIIAILQARYSTADLANLDETSLTIVKVYCMDIALYRVALAFSRSSETIKERYEATIKRLEAIASGKGALGLVGSGSGDTSDPAGSIDQNEVVITAPERMFTRSRLGRL